MQVIYEDNHIIIVSKRSGEIVQGDKTGDRTLADDVKQYIKEKICKAGKCVSRCCPQARPPRLGTCRVCQDVEGPFAS